MIHIEQVVDKRLGQLSHIFISYHDEHGKKQLLRFNVPESEKYEWVEVPEGYPTDETLISAHGKKLKKVKLKKYKRLSKFRVYELLNGLGDDMRKKLFSPNQPIKTFFDIETESTGSFPNAKNPKHNVLTNVFVTEEEVLIYGMKEMTLENVTSIERSIANHFSTLKNKSLVTKPYKVKYFKFDTEEELLNAIFLHINDNVDMLLGWNSLKFDQLYLANRSETVRGIDLYGVDRWDISYSFYKKMSPTGNVFDLRLVDKFAKDTKIIVPVPYHVPTLDYMEIMEKFDFPKRSKYSLDYVSNDILEGVKKISYNGSLQSLYDNDFEKFCLYNAVDSILVQLIDRATGIFDIVPTLSSIAEVPIHDALFAGMMCERMFQKEYHEEGKLFVQRETEETDESYEGGYVKEPTKGMAQWITIYDYTSMFPSGMMAFNFGIDTLLGQTTDYQYYTDDKSKEKVKIDLTKHCMSPNGYVYTKEKGDSSLRKMVFKLFNGRVERKDMAKEVDVEIQKVEKCGNKIPEGLKHCKLEAGRTYNDGEIFQELESMERLRKRLENESMAMKIIMNSIYGVLGYKYFPLYNVPVASSVTAQSRDLIQYTIDITNNYFKNEWFDDKEIHAELGLNVKNNVPVEVIYYADTDSVMVNMSHVLDTTDMDWRDDWEATRDKILEINEKFMNKFYAKKLEEYCDKWGAFHTRPDNEPSFNIKIEEIDYKTLFVKKKRYIKNPVWADGKSYKPNEKLSYKGVEMKKPSFPPFVREKLDQIMHSVMGQEGEFNLREVALETKIVRDEFMNADVENISVIERVNNFNKSLVSLDPLMFVSGAPRNHRAALRYNAFVSQETHKKYPKIQNGEKVGVYTTSGSGKDNDVFAFPVMAGVPEDAPVIDKKKQFEKVVLSPVNNILKVIDSDLNLDFNLNITTTNLW